MDNMKEMRKRLDNGKYNLTLEIAEEAYFDIYENVDLKSGEDLVRNYLRSNSDDACFNNIKIKYNKGKNTVKVTTELDYLENDHTDYSNSSKLM